MLRSAPVDVELSQRVHWLIQLRWLAASTVIYGTFMSVQIAGIDVNPLPLYLIGAAIAGYNSLFSIWLKIADVQPGSERFRQAKVIAHTQIVLDLVFLTLLIHFSGGVENPLSFFYIFHVIIASILLSRRDTFMHASIATILYGGLMLAHFFRLVPHDHLVGSHLTLEERLFVIGHILVFAATLYLAAYMATSIVGRLRERAREALELTSQLELKANELAGALEKVTELERLKSRYLHKVSHEIRQPLETISSTLKMSVDNISPNASPAQRERIIRAERQTESLLRLVDDLLMLSRAREARLFTHRKPVSMSDTAGRMVELYAPQAEVRQIELTCKATGDTPPLFADPEAMDQLLSNLISNALAYTPAGGRVEVVVDGVGSAVRLMVSDTGIGIPTTELPKIFSDFYRAENARRFCEEGTGLGLSIVRGIVEAHGGKVDVDSQVGFGTTFTVLLPIGKASPEEQPSEAELQARLL